MSDPKFIWRFSPNRTDINTLLATFVQRHAEVDDAVERVGESVLTGNKHQLLLVGPRGIGKTHFVTLVHHRVAHDAALAGRLRIAWLYEDEATGSLLDLLLRILRALAAAYPTEFPAEQLDSLYGQAAKDAAPEAARRLFEGLAGRTLLVIVENLDALFAGLGDAGQKQWRSMLQEHPQTTILATAQQLFDAVSRRTSPFFGFFQIDHLQPLGPAEAVELLTKLALNAGDQELVGYLRTPEGRARVRALHHLSGGNHRVYIILSQFIDRQSLDELIGPFEKMLDELTPYYQERLRWLSPQQRRIVEFLCTCDRPVPVKEIARRLFITEQTAAAQLKLLRDLGYVVGEARGRESRYELTEPLMRLSFEVKQSGHRPLRLIVEFLRVWYRPDELRHRLAGLALHAVREREHLLAALEPSPDDPLTAAILADIEQAKEDGRLEDAVLALEELAHTRGTAQDWFELGHYQCEVKRFDEAAASFQHMIDLEPKNPAGWNNRGVALHTLGRHQAALAYYDKALEIDPKSVHTWNNRGNSLGNLGRLEDALKSYEKALGIDPKDARAWHGRAHALAGLDRLVEALKSYEKALEINPQYGEAWNGRGGMLHLLGRREEALACYDKALEIDPGFAHAWSNRGALLHGLKRDEEALVCYDKALEIAPEYAHTWYNRAAALQRVGRYQEALESYHKAMEIKPDDRLSAFDCVEPLFALGRWEDGFRWLEACLSREQPPGEVTYCGETASTVPLILASTHETAVWRERVGRLVEIYERAGKLTALGEGLVESLGRIGAKGSGVERGGPGQAGPGDRAAVVRGRPAVPDDRGPRRVVGPPGHRADAPGRGPGPALRVSRARQSRTGETQGKHVQKVSAIALTRVSPRTSHSTVVRQNLLYL